MRVLAAVLIAVSLLLPTEAPMAPPANDNFADAIIVPESPYVSVPVNNTDAGMQTGEPTDVDGSPIGNTVWWSFTPTVSKPYRIDTTLTPAGSDTVVGVYTGSSVSALTLVKGNDDGPRPPLDFSNRYLSIVDVFLVAGTTYHIQVGGYSGEAIDGIVLQVAAGSWALTDETTKAYELGHTPPWTGAEIKTVSLGGGVGVTSYVTEYVEDGADRWYRYSVRAFRVEDDLSVTFGAEYLIDQMDPNYAADQTGLAYLGRDVVVQAGRQNPNLWFLKVNRSTLGVSLISSLRSTAFPGSAGEWDDVTVFGTGDGYGLAHTDRWNPAQGGYEMVWLSTDGSSVTANLAFDANTVTSIGSFLWSGRYALLEAGIAAAQYQGYWGIFDVDWAARSYTYRGVLTGFPNLWTAFGDESAAVSPDGTTLDVIYGNLSDRLSFVRDTPLPSGPIGSEEVPTIPRDLAQAAQLPYASWTTLVAVPDGTHMFSYLNESNYRHLLVRWDGSTSVVTDLIDIHDAEMGGTPNTWFFDGQNLVDVGNGKFIVVYSYDAEWPGYSGNTVIWRGGYMGPPDAAVSTVPPLRLSQRDDILSLVDGSGPRIKGHNQTRSQQDTRTARLKGLSLAGGGQRYL